MADRWITADRIFDGTDLRTDYALGLTADIAVTIVPVDQVPAGAAIERVGGTLVPGFLDLQVNGGGGVLLNTDPTPEGIAEIAAAHRRFGTTHLLPTVISDAPEVLHAAVSACIVARDLPGVVGLHIEGPHIAPARRGAHAARHIRPLDDVTLEGVAALRAAGLSALVTVAAEVVLPEDIARLVRAGAVVSIGHSDGTAAQVAAALAAGATCFTHLFNAMSQMTGRAPGVVGAAINSAAYASIIADGHHVVPEMVMMACRARPVADRMIAVSDAMPTVGGPDHFDLCGDPVRLVDGRLTNPDGTLAGAHLTMAQALHNLIGWGIAPETALRMCRGNPAALLGRADLQGLIRMRAQDLVVLDAEYRVAQVGV